MNKAKFTVLHMEAEVSLSTYFDMMKVSMTKTQAGCMTAAWMTGWIVAMLVSMETSMAFGQMMFLIYGGLVAVITVITWEHRKYYTNLINLDYCMNGRD